MKKILKFTLLFSFALPTTNLIWKNLFFENIPWTIVKVAIILSVFEILLKPIIKLILIPINILTLGLFRIIIDTFGLYLAIFLLNDFQISNISNITLSLFGISTPPLSFQNFWSFLITSVTLGIIVNFFNFILKKKPKPV